MRTGLEFDIEVLTNFFQTEFSLFTVFIDIFTCCSWILLVWTFWLVLVLGIFLFSYHRILRFHIQVLPFLELVYFYFYSHWYTVYFSQKMVKSRKTKSEYWNVLLIIYKYIFVKSFIILKIIKIILLKVVFWKVVFMFCHDIHWWKHIW